MKEWFKYSFLLMLGGFIAGFAGATIPDDVEVFNYTASRSGDESRLKFPDLYATLKEIKVKLKTRRLDLDLPGEYPHLEKIQLQGSFGDIWGHFDGQFEQLDEIEVSSTTGRVILDLRGDWQQDCKVHIQTTGGMISLKLPQGVGLLIEADTAGGKVYKKDKLKRKNWWKKQVWVNEEYGKAPITLRLDLHSIGGNVLLETEQ